MFIVVFVVTFNHSISIRIELLKNSVRSKKIIGTNARDKPFDEFTLQLGKKSENAVTELAREGSDVRKSQGSE